MTIIEATQSGFRGYVDFSGRASRSQFWLWHLFAVVALAPLGVVDQAYNPGTEMGVLSYIDMIAVFAMILPTAAVHARRLHDLDRSGWWALLSLTGVGGIVVFLWACEKGTPGANRFAPAPTTPAFGMALAR